MRCFFRLCTIVDRVGLVFLSCLAVGVALSYMQKPDCEEKAVRLGDVSFRTGPVFNLGSVVVASTLIFLYAFYR